MMIKLNFFVLTAGCLLGAFSPEGWRYRQKVEVSGAVTRVTLDPGFYENALVDMRDLRVVRDGVEVPYLWREAQAVREGGELEVRVVNKETRGGSLFVTLEFVGKAVLHNQVRLEVSRLEFRSQVRIEGSDDGRVWGMVRQGAYIFRYAMEKGQEARHTTLSYPDSRRRYLRLTLSGWPDAREFSGATVWSDASAEDRRSEIWAAERPKYETDRRTTCMALNTGSRAPRDTAQVTVAAGRNLFYRSVTVEASTNFGTLWTWVGAGAIYRVPGEEGLMVRFPETRLPRLRLCVYQGDDEPVLLESVKLLGVDRELVFRSEGPGSYWLYSGAPEAKAPEYDLARTAGTEFWSGAVPGKLGVREANPGFRMVPLSAKPWTERFPGLLYGVMGVAVAGIGWMALRLLKT